jgi:hypothetical protein
MTVWPLGSPIEPSPSVTPNMASYDDTALPQLPQAANLSDAIGSCAAASVRYPIEQQRHQRVTGL